MKKNELPIAIFLIKLNIAIFILFINAKKLLFMAKNEHLELMFRNITADGRHGNRMIIRMSSFHCVTVERFPLIWILAKVYAFINMPLNCNQSTG